MFVLREVPAEGLPPLKDALEKQLPESLAAHGYVDIKLRCNFERLKSKVLVASDFPIKSLVVVTPNVTWDGVQSLFLYYLEEESADASDNELASLLRSLPDLDWSQPVLLCVSPVHVINRVMDLLKRGLLSTNVQYHSLTAFRGHTFLFQAEKPSLNDIKIPEGFVLKSLHPEDMDEVYSIWQFNFSDSIVNYRELVTETPSSIIFEATKEGKERQRVSWALINRYGAMGKIHTQSRYRQRGLATAVILDLTRKMLSLGSPAYGVVEDSNEVSIAFHEKLGFRKACPTGWELVAPTHISMKSLGSSRAQEH